MKFREFYEKKHGTPYPAELGELDSVWIPRLMETLADYQDYLLDYIKAIQNRVY